MGERLKTQDYSLHELKRLVEGSGWSYKVCYGGYASEPFTTDSKRIILVVKKEGL